LLAPQRFDVSALVDAGVTLNDASRLPPGLTTIREGAGSDGQFSYQLGLDPFTNQQSAEGMSLDLPAYRQQRILYPLLAWALSLGQSTLLSAALALVNLAAIAGLAWWSARFAVLHGHSPLWGLALALLPGFAIALANDLGEIVLATCIVAAALALERRWVLRTTVALSLAVLAHEHGLVLLLAVALVTLSAPELRPRGWWMTWLVPLGVAAALQGQLAFVWREIPIQVAAAFLSSPFRGMLDISRQLIPPSTLSEALHLGSIVYLVIHAVACLWALRSTAAHRAVCLGWVLASVLLILGNELVWGSELSLWRAATLPLTLGFLVLIGSRSFLSAPVILLGGALGVTMAARLARAAWYA
jgi:hypothetical protein